LRRFKICYDFTQGQIGVAPVIMAIDHGCACQSKVLLEASELNIYMAAKRRKMRKKLNFTASNFHGL
jgi:hypothetical protein